jgi:hypothetical protein
MPSNADRPAAQLGGLGIGGQGRGGRGDDRARDIEQGMAVGAMDFMPAHPFVDAVQALAGRALEANRHEFIVRQSPRN